MERICRIDGFCRSCTKENKVLTTVDECCDFTCGGYTCNDGWVPDALKAYEFARLP